MAQNESTAAEFVLRTLQQYGVEKIFGNPGTTELPLMKSIVETDLDYELALHEDVAVGMAGGYASSLRYRTENNTLPLGVVNLHAIGGLMHGLGNLYGAHRSNVPLLITAGAQSTNYRHKDPILTGDMVNLVDDFTKWSDEVLDPDALPHLLRRAVRAALAPPAGPVFLSLPMDLLEAPIERDPIPLGDLPTPGPAPAEKIESVGQELQSADEPIFVLGDELGAGGQDATDEMVRLAEETGAMVFGEVLAAQCSFPADHDQWVSFLPPEGELITQLLDTDFVMLVGCESNTPLFRDGTTLIPGGTTCVHLHTDAGEIGKNERVDIALHGDMEGTLSNLADQLKNRVDPELRKQRLETGREVQTLVDARFEEHVAQKPEEGRCSKPEVVSALREEFEDCFLVDEGVTGRYALLKDWPLQPEGYLSNKGGALGYGLPASVGASLALVESDPDRRVIGYVGDGSFWYYPQSLYGALKEQLPLTVIVLNNRGYSILKDKLEEFYNHTATTPGMDLNEKLSSPKAAESQDLRATSVSSTEGLIEALKAEADASGPGLIEVLVHD